MTQNKYDSDIQESEKDLEIYNQEEQLQKPDGGWGWMVVLGGFLVSSLVMNPNMSFGIIFSGLLTELGSSSTTIAWIYNIHGSIIYVAGFFAVSLSEEFGPRPVAMFGTLLCTISVMLTSFAQSEAYLFLTFSFLTAVGTGLGYGISSLIVPQYFDKRKGTAYAIITVGICAPFMYGPPLARYLLEEYGFLGANLILGAITFHSFFGSLLFHPVKWHLKKVPRKPEDNSLVQTPPTGKRIRTLSESLSEASQSSIIYELNATNGVTLNTEQYEEKDPSTTKRPGLLSLRRVWKSLFSSFSLLSSPSALIVSLGGATIVIGYPNFIMMIPFAVQAKGHTLEVAAWCLSLIGVANIVSRLLTAHLSDSSWFSKKAAYMGGSFFLGVMSVAIWGCALGANISLHTLIMIDVIGVENLPRLFGASCFIISIACVTAGPLLGWIRDTTQSYDISLIVAGGVLFMCFVFWLFMPLAQKYERKQRIRSEKV